MCDGSRLCRLVLCLAGLVASVAAGRNAGAQSADPLDGHRRAVMAAKEAYDTAYARERADSARRARLPVIRTYAGLEVRSDTINIAPELLRALDSTFTSTLAEARTLFGAPTDTLLLGIRVSITARYATTQLQRAGGVPGLVTLVYDGVQGHGYGTVSARPVDAAAITDHFVMWFGRAAGQQLPPPLIRWARPEIPVRANEAAVNRSAYVRLATYPSTVARACLDGSHVGCRASLAIVPGGDTAGVWFDASARRARVRSHGVELMRRSSAVQRCMSEGSDADCRTALQQIGVPSPTVVQVRQQFIRRALVRGGPDAFTRLVNARADDVASLLEIAAGVPFDSLADEWRSGVLAARSPSPSPNGRELGISLAVGVLAIGLASRRRP